MLGALLVVARIQFQADLFFHPVFPFIISIGEALAFCRAARSNPSLIIHGAECVCGQKRFYLGFTWLVFKASSLSPPILRYIHSFDRFLFGLGVDLSRHKLYAIKQICLGPQNGKNQSSLVAGH